MGARVRLTNVSKRYGDTVALRELDLEVEPGEVLTILGPSGSGKTTTLMLLAGIVRPTAGRLEIGGKDITDLPPYRRDIGVVFQSYALFPHLSVFENVAFPLRRRGVARAQIAGDVQQALELVQLGGLGARGVKQLSGGQQQRVALARALVFRPALLLMDEPLGALDKQLREQMQIEIKHITDAVGITAIYVTHDQEEALTLSDRIAVLRGGVLEQIGTPEELYNAPRTRFVAGFVGHTNLVEGEVIAGTGAASRVRTPDGLDIELDARVRPARGPVALSVRPERIRLAPAAAPAPAGEALGLRAMGKVTDRIFAGGVVKYRVAVNSRHFLVCTGNDGADVRPGDEVALSWRPDDVHVVQEDRA
jgi:spermidine/putrescine ABC transporter ATP-binding subunit